MATDNAANAEKDKCPICGEELKAGEIHELEKGKCPNEEKCPNEDVCPYRNGAIGSSADLGNFIIKSSVRDINLHPLYTGEGSLAAHHLIPAQAPKNDDDLKKIFRLFNYNINCKKNGVYLTTSMKVACHLSTPVHRGSHKSGRLGEFNSASYVTEVKKLVENARESLKNAQACKKKQKDAVSQFNEISEEIFENIAGFEWSITSDGFNYKEGHPIGCGNNETISKKRDEGKREKCRQEYETSMTEREKRSFKSKDMKERFDNMMEFLKNEKLESFMDIACQQMRNHEDEFKELALTNPLLLKIVEKRRYKLEISK